MKTLLKNLLSTLLLCLFATHLWAQIIFTPETDKIILKKDVWILHQDSNYTPQQALLSDKFKQVDQKFPNLGSSEKGIWLRFSLKNLSSQANLLLEVAYPILDQIALYSYSGNNKQLEEVHMGESIRFSDRKYSNPNFVFDLNVPHDSTITYLLFVSSAEQLIVPISISKPTVLWTNLTKDNLITGIYVGIVLIMFIYNLFIYFSVRDKSYLFYVGYVIAAGLTQVGIQGHTFQYLWPNSPSFETISVILFACLSGIFALIFTNDFLLTRTKAKFMFKANWFVIFLFSIALIILMLGKTALSFNIMQSATSLSALSILISSIIVTIRGYDPAKYFLFAWSALLTGAIIFLLKDIGVLPYNNITRYSVQAASAVEMALLSFGLANRINILKKEKEASQQEALAIAMENERIIREQNITLETKVKERTVELEESNSNLNIALDDLKQAQTQLVEQEKMASLGQLTAGIAHEINNPINFVTSNVKPLKRDVDLLLDLMNKIESVGMGNESIESKTAEIKKLKTDFDFDYLLEEIRFLLKGINEGSSRTAEIVKGLRLFSRVDEDDIKIADIHDGLDSTLIIINNSLSNKIEIHKEYTTNLPPIECYPGKLNQVFLNILSNGVYAIKTKFGEQPGGVLGLKTEKFDQNIRITLSDNGSGMDQSTQKKLFEPFFTTKPVGEGTGLGLSIVLNTINKHNGRIEVQSNPGEGTSFIITLPMTHVTINQA